jgi:mRNA interferase RelE/StbE
MSYDIEFSDTADAALRAMNKQAAKRIMSKLESIRDNPFAHVKRLVGVPLFSLRVGDYRVIMDIKSNRMLIFVERVEHRSRIYDEL